MILLSDQERSLLVDEFSRSLTTIEQHGADFAELQVLLGLLKLSEEAEGTNPVLELLLVRVKGLLEAVVPNQLTLEEAAGIYNANADTLRRACWSGKLPGEKLGGTWLVRTTDLEQYLARTKRRTRRSR
jgi:excisionase family DNA binding protein